MYGILPGKYSDNFTINPDTGVLTNAGELDREALNPDLDGTIEINVTATDKGIPALSSTVPVIINLEVRLRLKPIDSVLLLILLLLRLN